MFKRFALVIICSLLLFGGLFGWKFKQIGEAIKNIPIPPPPVVAVSQVRTEAWPNFLTGIGSLKPVAGVEVSAEIAGKVKAIHFDSGQEVRRGQLLLELDDSTDLAELEGLQATEQLEKSKFARSQRLINRNFIAKSDYDINKASLDAAKAAVAAKLSVIGKKRIVAPFSGQMGIRKVNLGQYLAPGDSIAPLQQLQPIHVDFTLPEQQLAHLSEGQLVTLNVQPYPNTDFSGRISAMNSGIDEATRSVVIRATLDNSGNLLRPGMFAEVNVRLGADKPVLTIPDTAVTYNPYGNSVYVVLPDKAGFKVELRQVQTGETRNGRVEIVKGLNASEQVVSAGQVKLRNGIAVTLAKVAAPGERGMAP